MEPSLFSKLPPELCNRIFELALYVPSPVKIRLDRHQQKTKGLQKPLHAAALTQTCRHMREHFMAMYYAVNRFRLVTKNDDTEKHSQLRNFELWLESTGPFGPSALKDLELDMGRWYCRQPQMNLSAELGNMGVDKVAKDLVDKGVSFTLKIRVQWCNNTRPITYMLPAGDTDESEKIIMRGDIFVNSGSAARFLWGLMEFIDDLSGHAGRNRSISGSSPDGGG